MSRAGKIYPQFVRNKFVRKTELVGLILTKLLAVIIIIQIL
jgi:hypothetical protein